MNLTKVNIFSNWAIQILRIAIVFFTLPILYNKLSKEEFGAYAIFTGLTVFISIFDFGLFNFLNKITVSFLKYNNKENYFSGLNYSINIIKKSLLFILVSGLLILFFSNYIFNFSNNFKSQFYFTLAMGVLNNLFFALSTYSLAIIQGKQKNYLHNFIIFISFIFNIIIYYFLENDYIFFKDFIICITILNLFILFGDLFVLYKLDIFKFNKLNIIESENKLYIESRKKFSLLNIFGFFSSNGDKFILASLANLSTVGIYEIISKPFFLLKSFNGNFFNIFQSRITLLSFKDQVKLITRLTEILVYISFIIFIFSYLFLEKLLIFWLKDDTIGEIAFLSRLMIVSFLFSLIISPIYRKFLLGRQLKYILKVELIGGLINALISIIGVKYVGFQYVIYGSFIQYFLTIVFLLYLAHRYSLIKFSIKKILNLIFSLSFIIVSFFNNYVFYFLVLFFLYKILFSKENRYLKLL